jgi:hypothetical protein
MIDGALDAGQSKGSLDGAHELPVCVRLVECQFLAPNPTVVCLSAESVSEFQIKAMRLTVYSMQSVFHGHSSCFRQYQAD